MLLNSLTADSLALGPHWIYDRADLASKFPTLDILSPPATSYHPGKQAGDQSHLGDQAKLLAESLLATKGTHDGQHFLQLWRAFYTNPETLSYKDKATKTVLETNAASPSTELGGLARTAPLAALLLRQGHRGAALANGLYQHVRLTHQSQASEQATLTLAELLSAASDGRDLSSLLPPDPLPELATGDAIEKIGQSCDASKALPACQLLLRRHAADPARMLKENALAGGDSAARGLFLGMILGASKANLPSAWTSALRAKDLVTRFNALLG
jgi:ADP-ribosylglycohydrolase